MCEVIKKSNCGAIKFYGEDDDFLNGLDIITYAEKNKELAYVDDEGEDI